MMDEELIEAIKSIDLRIETVEEKIAYHEEELNELRLAKETMLNALLLSMKDREKPKKIFCCFRRSKG